ncbi:MAG TPA: protein translocase subunit SecD [Opitutaceae bacterium]|jgi:SecD/SecF fusion protein|nr:protein translocase subunit SecD [Opitutaceae bacterium]
MLKRNLWKLVLSVLIVAWAVSELLPLNNQPFVNYARTHVTAKPTEFGQLLDQAVARKKSGQALSEFVGLKQIAKEQKIDLTDFFPNINIESALKNVDKRNDILLNELLHRSKSKLQLGLDLNGGIAVTLEVDPKLAGADPDNVRQEKLAKAIEIISARINAFGVAEPVIRPIGNNRIEIQLPGINTKDNPEILENIKKPAQLSFRLVHPTLTPPAEAPAGYEAATLDYEGRNGESGTEELFVKRIPEMTGEAISNAFARPDLYGRPEVILQFTDKGKARFAEVTREIAAEGQRSGRPGRLAIVLDGKLYSAPTVREEIDSNSAQISGNFTDREALDLANVLNNPLDLPLVVKEQYEVGPSLAEDAISSGVRASVIAVVLVAGFMITYYMIGGVIAVATLAVNVLAILAVMASLGATMTLPGLAGVVLTIGMAVDANILIFERMREELNLGKSLKAALIAGYNKAFVTIIDAHITQLAICAVMILWGNGPIKGFGVTLAIGVFSTMFSVLVTGHIIMEWLIEKDIVKKFPMLHLLSKPNMDFVKWAKPAFLTSWTIVLIGVAVVFYKGNKIYGIDFAGGDVINISFHERLDPSKIRATATAAGLGDIDPVYVSELGSGKETLKLETAYGKADTLLAALQKDYPAAGLDKIGESQIGASIGKEVEWNAFIALALSMVVVLIYVAFRFEFGFGIGAVVASVHDILMTIGVFVLFGYQFSAPMVAAILCIAGYSINDTIVVFDRIREELKLNPNMKLRDVINLAINRVFSRSIMTSLTAFLAALALFLFGGGVLHELSFTFLVGIITGTFSSIFIASPVFYWWHKGDRKHVEAHSDVAPKYEWQGTSRASQ